MFNLNRRLLWVLWGAGFCVFVAAFYLVTSGTTPPPLPPRPPSGWNTTLPNLPPDLPPPPQCLQPIFHDSALRIAGAWEALLFLEALIFALTLYRCIVHCWSRDGVGPGSALLKTLTFDGAWYFLAIVLVNAGNLFMYYFGDTLLAGSLTWFASSMSSVLVARLMLNLHAAVDSGIYDQHKDTALSVSVSDDFIVVPGPTPGSTQRRSRSRPHSLSLSLSTADHVDVEVELQPRGPSMTLSVIGEADDAELPMGKNSLDRQQDSKATYSWGQG